MIKKSSYIIIWGLLSMVILVSATIFLKLFFENKIKNYVNSFKEYDLKFDVQNVSIISDGTINLQKIKIYNSTNCTASIASCLVKINLNTLWSENIELTEILFTNIDIIVGDGYERFTKYQNDTIIIQNTKKTSFVKASTYLNNLQNNNLSQHTPRSSVSIADHCDNDNNSNSDSAYSNKSILSSISFFPRFLNFIKENHLDGIQKITAKSINLKYFAFFTQIQISAKKIEINF